MRAVVFDRAAPDASATRIADIEVPQPGPAQIAIDVVAAGVNFIDVMARRGDPGYADGWPFVAGLEVAAPGARIVLFGNAAGGAPEPLPTAGRLFALNASIGAFSLSRMATQLPQRIATALDTVLTHLASGALRVEMHELDGLDAVPAVHQELAEGRGSGKRVIRVAAG
jgi:NADPH:quinone reductase-like Zn-dependent oxidoreductase